MQQTGCLKKRRKRNLTKVSSTHYNFSRSPKTTISFVYQVAGLTVAAYDEASDTFRGLDMYDSSESNHNAGYNNYLKVGGDNSTSITMSRIHQARQNGSRSSSTRITRDPHFLIDDDDGSDSETGPQQLMKNRRHIGFPPDMKRSRSSVPDTINKTSEALSRPNLLDKKVMQRLYQLVTLGLVSGSFPWYWNKKKAYVEKFSPMREKIWNVICFFLSLQMLFVFGFQIYSFYNRVANTTLLTYREIFMGSFSLYWYGLNNSFTWNLYLHKESIRQYINTMLDMNKKFCGKVPTHSRPF